MQKNTGLIRDFTTGNITAHLISFGAPLFFSNLLQAVYNMVDMVVVGQYVGKNGLSAVSIGGDVLMLLTFLSMGFSMAGQVIIAQHIGAGKREQIGKIIGNLFVLLLSCAAVLTIVCFCFRSQILTFMNTPSEVWDYTMSYATTCILGLIFIYGYNVVSAVLRGMGDSRHPFMFIATAAVLNLVLDLLFVAVFHMAAFGAALATVIGQGVSFIWGLIFFIRRHRSLEIGLNRECFYPDKAVVNTIVRLGVPMALKSASISFSKVFVDSRINAFGVIASSASGIESKLNTISNLFSNAINVSGSTMIGQNIGAEKYDRVPKIMFTAFKVTASIAVILSLVLIVFPGTVFGIFTGDADVIRASMQMIPLLVLIFAGTAVRSPNNGLIDGSGNYKLNFVTAILDGIINRIGFAMLFGLVMNMGWIGYLYGDAVAGLTPLLIGGVYFLSGSWRTRKYVIHEN
jgi:putative MATE family efflux protein